MEVSKMRWLQREKNHLFCLHIFTGPTAITNSTMFGEGAGPVVYSNVLCDGWESQILLCPKNIYGSFQCSNANAAGVICRDGG